MPNILTPPFRFGLVGCSTTKGDELLYRGAYPTKDNISFLSKLKLRTWVMIVPPDQISIQIVEFCKDRNVKMVVFDSSSYQVESVLRVILNKNNFPTFIHCLDGASETGKVIMHIRKMMRWTQGAIWDECLRFSKKGDISDSDEKAVGSFSPSLLGVPDDQRASWVPAPGLPPRSQTSSSAESLDGEETEGLKV